MSVQIPYYVGKGKQRRIGGYWECSPEDAAWALAKDWRLIYGYPHEKGPKGRRASRSILERELGRPLLENEDAHHLDKNITNNVRENLEAKNRQLHLADHKRYERPLGELGVSFCQGRWMGRISHLGRSFYLGRFDTREEANAAYRRALTRIEQGLSPKD